MKQKPYKNVNGMYLVDLVHGLGVSYPTLKSWLPGLGVKVKHVKARGVKGYVRAVLTHVDATKVQEYAKTRKRIKEAKKARKAK